MARLPRMFVPGIASHVILRGNDRQNVFTCDGDRLAFLGYLREAAEAQGLEIHAYVLMSNHVHLLATGSEPRSLAMTIQAVGRKYVPRFNRLFDRTGTLWEGRYRSTLVQADRYALHCQRYIELNPVRAGMVARAVAYEWSSHLHFAWGKPDDLVTPHLAFESLGEDDRQRAISYRQFFERDVPDDMLRAIRDASHKGWALGTTDFCEAIQAMTGRRAQPLPRGPKGAGGKGS